MTQPLDLDPILGRLDAATEGPWQRSEDYSDVLTPEGDHIASFWKTSDGELIAHAPEDITAMAAEIRRLRARVAELERPAVEAKRNEIRQSFTELIAQAEQDRDHEGAFSVQCRLREREEQWKAEDAAAASAAARP